MENEKDKKSIIKEAIVDYNEIINAAELNARKKLAEEFPGKFKDLLNEELKNNKNKTEKESYKKIDEQKESNTDESDANKKIVMETKETKKEKKEVENVDDVVKKEKAPKKDDVDNEKTEKTDKKETSKKEVVENDVQKGKKSEVNEEFDISSLNIDDIDSAIDSANENDEVLTIEEIEREISDLEALQAEGKEDFVDGDDKVSFAKDGESTPYDKLVQLKNQIQEVIDTMSTNEGDVDEQKRQGGKQNFAGREKGGPTKEMIDEEEPVDEMHKGNYSDATVDKMQQGKFDRALIDEDDLEISDADIDALLDDESEVDEQHGISHAKRKLASGDRLPRKGQGLPKSHEPQLRSARQSMSENAKKLKALIEDNKKLSKKLSEVKKQKETHNALLENYKTALGKYRTQLKEMAVFNTNLAHVNNLLVNEELALTQDDKVKIIKEFKKIGSLTESQEKYKSLLSEMKETKKNISEELEDKVSSSVASSSKKKLDEVVEKTAYENNDHIKKIKRLMEYVDRRGKK